MAFLSLLDDRAKPKGSRDPLGFEVVWSYFGRKVIGNLTTITSSVDNFSVAILGFYWANKLVPAEVTEDRGKKVRDWFIRYEQLTGYVRHHGGAKDIMGITRIKNRIREGEGISFGVEADQQILSDQASYGLWGLYSSASRDTGLIEGEERYPTDIGQEIALTIIEKLGSSADELFRLMQSDDVLNAENLKGYATVFMQSIRHEQVRVKLLGTLMSGNKRHELQEELWQKTQLIFTNAKSGEEPDHIGVFIDALLNQKPSHALSDALSDIKKIERLLVATNDIFHYTRSKDGTKLADILTKFNERPYNYLPASLPIGDFHHRQQLVSILDAFHQKDFKRVIYEVFNLNKIVMDARGSAPWVELKMNKISVKVKSEISMLKDMKHLKAGWDYDYFIGSFLQIARQQLSRSS